MERFSASRFVEQAIHHEATLAALFAAPIRMLLAQPRSERDRATRLRAASYAQNITLDQWEEWHARFGARLMQIWGMTETMSLALIHPLDLPPRPLAMGMPALGYECKVVDESGKEAPPGTVGELVVSGVPGVSLMKGYFKNETATAEALRDGWLYTGDQARMDEDGWFFFVDRKKDMIKRAGENVSASEVEETLKQHPAVFDAAVVGIPDPVRDQAIKAYVIVKDGASPTAEDLIAWCRERLSSFKVPELIEFRESFPRTSVGKIQKHCSRKETERDRHAAAALHARHGEPRLPGLVLDRPRQDQGGGVRADDVKETFDDATQLAIRDQERAGIDMICDGEMRRFFFVQSFYGRMEGLEPLEPLRKTGLYAYDSVPRYRAARKIRSGGTRDGRGVPVPPTQTDRPVKATSPAPSRSPSTCRRGPAMPMAATGWRSCGTWCPPSAPSCRRSSPRAPD